ncbi:hypothetical protein HDE_09361 [Halotydeus destructor]|nr:hypothetical protein HDE_09361 [Halotydeus destructor]
MSRSGDSIRLGWLNVPTILEVKGAESKELVGTGAKYMVYDSYGKNITYVKLEVTGDHHFGTCNATGHCTGLLNDYHKYKLDAIKSLIPLAIDFDFDHSSLVLTPPVVQTGVRILSEKELPTQIGDSDVAESVMAIDAHIRHLYFVWALLLYVLVFVIYKYVLKQQAERRNLAWNVYRGLFSQFNSVVKQDSVRSLFALYVGSIFLLATHYNASFKTDLTIKSPPSDIDSFENAMSSNREIWLQGIVSTVYVLKDHTKEIYSKMWSKIEETKDHGNFHAEAERWPQFFDGIKSKKAVSIVPELTISGFKALYCSNPDFSEGSAGHHVSRKSYFQILHMMHNSVHTRKSVQTRFSKTGYAMIEQGLYDNMVTRSIPMATAETMGVDSYRAFIRNCAPLEELSGFVAVGFRNTRRLIANSLQNYLWLCLVVIIELIWAKFKKVPTEKKKKKRKHMVHKRKRAKVAPAPRAVSVS